MRRILTALATAAMGLMAVWPAFGAQAEEETKAGATVQAGAVKPEMLQRWQNMTPEQREKIRERMQRWRAMTPEERQRILQNMERFRKLTPEQRERLIQARQRWEQVPPEVRQRMHRQFERFKELPPEVRERIMQRMAVTRELLKGDFEAFKAAPEDQREALRKQIHLKMRALKELKGEQLDELRKMTPEEQAAKLKELIEKLPPEIHTGHGTFGPHHHPGENGKPEETKPEAAPAETPPK